MKFHIQIFKIIIFLSGIMFLTSYVASGQYQKKYIRKGNGKYSDEKFPESEILYRKAIDANKMPGDALFNLGDALYKQNKFEDAGKNFVENAEKTKDSDKKADSYYNLGNSLLKGDKLKESITAYKNSLKLNPDNAQAKFNLAYAQDLLRMQEQQQQQQQQGDNKQQDKDKDSKDQQPNKDQEKQDQQQQKNSQPQQQQQQSQPQQISKEDAQRLLDALANDEKKVQEKVKEAKAAKARVKTLINW